MQSLRFNNQCIVDAIYSTHKFVVFIFASIFHAKITNPNRHLNMTILLIWLIFNAAISVSLLFSTHGQSVKNDTASISSLSGKWPAYSTGQRAFVMSSFSFTVAAIVMAFALCCIAWNCLTFADNQTQLPFELTPYHLISIDLAILCVIGAIFFVNPGDKDGHNDK